ncbi:YdeI/OmpD-associated family protein [Pedobacter punctiformis]|uniref:Thymidylate synthase n=1 Tax=Pedobacter punctiformis TaxID=3004097 RepID=A0ABT4L4Y1_9SPHI|nr:hypothetical protein [Pedobacter sp. HCMS5-2]MCZ4242971.1 hypothetical protein [Pedobacter sp. HCMS5-2]
METNKGIETFYAETRQKWREWLEQNGQLKTEVCLILYSKNAKTPSVNYVEAVEEALCFGWIDSLTNKRDADSRYQRFSQRKPKSNWSSSNKERVAKLTEQGLMTEHGQKMIDLAKQNGNWESIN